MLFKYFRIISSFAISCIISNAFKYSRDDKFNKLNPVFFDNFFWYSEKKKDLQKGHVKALLALWTIFSPFWDCDLNEKKESKSIEANFVLKRKKSFFYKSDIYIPKAENDQVFRLMTKTLFV